MYYVLYTNVFLVDNRSNVTKQAKDRSKCRLRDSFCYHKLVPTEASTTSTSRAASPDTDDHDDDDDNNNNNNNNNNNE
ncbi:hypothetical protein M0804_002117 [Polistes exclamans]|nr:hypothetical protein M0804_002117 [Polistes exclamans]